MKKIIVIAIFGALTFSGCGKNEKWSLFIYPYGNPSDESIKMIDSYKSFEECVRGYDFNKKGFPDATFECGYKCKMQDAGLGLYICKETRDQ